MNNKLPDRVRSAIAQPAAEPHPPADLLNAYAENALLPPERAYVLDHLGRCAECREIIMLASGAAEDEPAPAAVVLPARRWRWMTWAAPATAAVVVLAVVLYDRQAFEPTRQPAASHLPVTPAAPVAPDRRSAPSDAASIGSGTTAAASRAKPKAARADDDPDKTAYTSQTLAAELYKKNESDAEVTRLRQLNTLERKGSLSNMAQSPPAFQVPPAPAEMADQIVTTAPEPTTQFESAADRSLRPRKDSSEIRATVGLAESAPPAAWGAKASRPGLQMAPGGSQVIAQPAPRNAHWRVTSHGAVEWSTDSKVWNRVLDGSTHKYKVLAVVGDDLWAGGEGRRLVHSIDRGGSWKEVVPRNWTNPADGLKKSSIQDDPRGFNYQAGPAIVSISFRDVMNGEIRTDDGETWVTADRGQTWRRK